MTAPASTTPARIAVLGSTGSVGAQTLDVIAHSPERFSVVALAARHPSSLLQQQIDRFRPDLVAIHESSGELQLRHERVEIGPESLIAAATHVDADLVVVATAGHAAIVPTMRAIEANKQIALANKETIVCAGEIIMPLAQRHDVRIRPVDSEHSAIWQALGDRPSSEIARLIVTASGGPFRNFTAHELATVSATQALAHPTWAMGDKITIDSATLMNKGLEVIEAHWLFGVDFEHIDVLIHPESIVHSLVEFADRSQIAQLSRPDMRLPIQYALTYPEHAPSPCRPLSLADVSALHFHEPDVIRFPALTIARAAGAEGGTAPTVLSASDEIAVEAFIAGRIRFPDIAAVVAGTLERHRVEPADSVERILAADVWARAEAADLVARRSM